MECKLIKYIQKRRHKNKKKDNRKVETCKLGDYGLKRILSVLVWNRLRVIVSMLGSRGVPSLQGFSNAKRAFINDTRIIKVYATVE